MTCLIQDLRYAARGLMKNPGFSMVAVAFLCSAVTLVAVSPLAAQSRVRLQVESESWLSPTPFDAVGELTAKLRDANIEITDDTAAPLVKFVYVENAGLGYRPRLVPGTEIRFEINVTGSDGSQYMQSYSVSAVLRDDGTDFPSAAELRLRAIDAFRRHKSFHLAGHIVGTALGLEASFRALLAAEKPDKLSFVYWLLFSRLSWSPVNDDLFEQAFQGLRTLGRPRKDLPEQFLKKNLPVLQSSTATGMRGPLLAIGALGEYGESSARQLLLSLSGHPHLGQPALAAFEKIEARLASAP